MARLGPIDADGAGRRATMRRCGGALVLAVTSLLVGGCASVPPPRDLDLNSLRLVTSAKAPEIDVNGLPGGKAVGAGVGAGTGSGAGVLVSGAACLATGPLFPLCALALVPTGALVGAVAGGVVGAVKTESVEAMALKTKLLRDQLAAVPYPRLLAEQLRQALQEQRGIAAGIVDAPASPETNGAPIPAPVAAAPWSLDVAVVEVGTEGKKEFALRLVARVSLRRGDGVAPVWTVAKEVQSETELTTDGWAVDDARPLHAVLDRCLRQAASELMIELTRPSEPGKAAPHPRRRYSSSCNDVPADVAAALR